MSDQVAHIPQGLGVCIRICRALHSELFTDVLRIPFPRQKLRTYVHVCTCVCTSTEYCTALFIYSPRGTERPKSKLTLRVHVPYVSMRNMTRRCVCASSFVTLPLYKCLIYEMYIYINNLRFWMAHVKSRRLDMQRSWWWGLTSEISDWWHEWQLVIQALKGDLIYGWSRNRLMKMKQFLRSKQAETW